MIARVYTVIALVAMSVGANPLKLATQARLDLEGLESAVILTNGAIAGGTGWLRRKTWLAGDVQPRSYSVQWDIDRYGWTRVGVEFLPLGSGRVEVRLMGPWEQDASNITYRQEVFWDDGRASGTALPNPSFEIHSGNTVSGWSHPGHEQVVTNGPPPPADGQSYVKLWHNYPLITTVDVTAGVPVQISFAARAAMPSNQIEMVRIGATDTPAHSAAYHFMRGVNLGNYLEADPGQGWSVPYAASEFAAMHAEGFDHVRIPVGWQYYTGPGPDCTLSSDIFAKADFLVDHALSNGLAVIINTHHFDDFTSNPPAHSDRFVRIWRQVAEHYAGYPPELAFEFLNEPKDAADTATMNTYYLLLLAVVRASNPARPVFVGPGQWNGIHELDNLWLPEWDSNLIVTVHCYLPFYFTHQGASWTSPQTATTNLVYPGPPPAPVEPVPEAASNAWVRAWFEEYNTLPTERNPCSRFAFEGLLDFARAWSDYYGRPVHVGEFGCYIRAPHDSRIRYYREMRTALEMRNLGWAMWDWHAGFHYWDTDSNRPVDGMPGAMFPPPVLRWEGDGRLGATGAKGKRLVLESASPGIWQWQPVVTQTLSGWRYQTGVGRTGMVPRAAYRVRWLK